MIRYSHVSLLIPCDRASAAEITETLGIPPTRVREHKSRSQQPDGSWRETTGYSWMLESPLGHGEGNPTARLEALADTIEPIAALLPQLRQRFRLWIDMLYHITPQHPHGVTGEFDMLILPAALMRRFTAWDLDVAYEVMWFDHPQWKRPE